MLAEECLSKHQQDLCNRMSWTELWVLNETGRKRRRRFEVWTVEKCWCGWCDNSEAWEESTGADLVCLACVSHPFNENGMQCPPPTHTHTRAPTPHCTEPHCVPLCTPTTFNFKAANNNKEGEGEWGWINECAPSSPRSPSLQTPRLLPACPLSAPALCSLLGLQPCFMTVASVCYTHIC